MWPMNYAISDDPDWPSPSWPS